MPLLFLPMKERSPSASQTLCTETVHLRENSSPDSSPVNINFYIWVPSSSRSCASANINQLLWCSSSCSAEQAWSQKGSSCEDVVCLLLVVICCFGQIYHDYHVWCDESGVYNICRHLIWYLCTDRSQEGELINTDKCTGILHCT